MGLHKEYLTFIAPFFRSTRSHFHLSAVEHNCRFLGFDLIRHIERDQVRRLLRQDIRRKCRRPRLDHV